MAKSQKFIIVCFGIWLFLFLAACSNTGSATLPTVQNQNSLVHIDTTETDTPIQKNAGTLDCNKPNEYGFVVVENPNRKSEAEPLMPKDLNIAIGDKVVARIELPIADSEAKNFSLNSVEKTKGGFEIKVDWGGGANHYEIEFDFKCKENGFYLYKVKNENFSTSPNSRSFWDKKETKVTNLKPNLPIDKFAMLDYLQ